MVKYNPDQLDAVFSALSDRTRRGIIAHLAERKLTAQELAAPYSISLPAISKHLKVLEQARLIKRKVEGRTHTFSLNVMAMKKAEEWLQFHQQYWHESLSNLERLLKNKKHER